MKKTAQIAVRLEPADFDFLQSIAQRLELPTDGRPILGRAVQRIVKLMRASFAAEEVAGQGLLGQLCLRGAQ